MIRKVFLHFRQHFLTGIFVIIPIAVILWVARFLVRILWSIHDTLPKTWRLASQTDASLSFIDFFLFIAGLGLICFLIALLGWSSKKYVGMKALEALRNLLERIPFLGTIYGALDQLFKTLGAGGQKQFSRVVMLEYPRKGIRAIAFVTGEVKGSKFPKDHLNVFIPTVPNPTSGFHLIVPVAEVEETGLSVEDAFRIILSLGLAQGTPNKKNVKETSLE